MKLTRTQTEAFFEAMFGWVDHEMSSTPKSPHIVTHFNAVFGTYSYLTPNEIQRSKNKPYNSSAYIDERRKVADYIEYFEAIVESLEDGLGGKEPKP